MEGAVRGESGPGGGNSMGKGPGAGPLCSKICVPGVPKEQRRGRWGRGRVTEGWEEVTAGQGVRCGPAQEGLLHQSRRVVKEAWPGSGSGSVWSRALGSRGGFGGKTQVSLKEGGEVGGGGRSGPLLPGAQRKPAGPFGPQADGEPGVGGCSGPPALPETTARSTASPLPPAASTMRPRCSIPGTSVLGLPQHQAGFVRGGGSLRGLPGEVAGRSRARGALLRGQGAVGGPHRRGRVGAREPSVGQGQGVSA